MVSAFFMFWKSFFDFSAIFRQISPEIFSILCVDENKEFCAYVKQVALSLNIKSDQAHTLVQAQEKIENKNCYTLFIIGGYFLDGSGLELIAWIREKKQLDTPIIFLSQIYHDAVSFRILKESLKVDFVLEKPVKPQELKALLIQIYAKENRGYKLPQGTFNQFETDYQKTILDKIGHLEKIIQAVQNKATLENMQFLKIEIHKLAGSASSYGYSKVSELCTHLELELIRQMALLKQDSQNQDLNWLKSLNQFFAEIKLAYQISPLEEFNRISSTDLQNPIYSLYLVDNQSDKSRTQNSYLGKIKNKLIETDLKEAGLKLIDPHFIAQVIIFHVELDEKSDCDSWINLNYAQGGAIFGFISKDTRMLVKIWREFEKKLSIFFNFFPDFTALNFMFNLSIQKVSRYKILVFDEDKDITNFIKHSLAPLGFDLKILNDFLLLREAIAKENPDILIIDIDLADSKKAEIIPLLNRIDYKNLFIALVTIKHEAELIKRIYGSSVDEILLKPLDRMTLQKTLLSLLKKTDLIPNKLKQNLRSEDLKGNAYRAKEVWFLSSNSSYGEKISKSFEKINYNFFYKTFKEITEVVLGRSKIIFIFSGLLAQAQALEFLNKWNSNHFKNIPILYLSYLIVEELKEVFEEEFQELDYLVIVIQNQKNVQKL